MPIASLREGGRGMRGGLARRGLRQALVVAVKDAMDPSAV